MALQKDQQYCVYFDPDIGEKGAWCVRTENWQDEEMVKVEYFQEYDCAADLCAILTAFAHLDGYFGMYSFLNRALNVFPNPKSKE